VSEGKVTMHCIWIVLLLIVSLMNQAEVFAQASQEASSAQEKKPIQEEEVPSIADLIPLATALSGRLVNLEKTIEKRLDLSEVERRVSEIEATLGQYAQEFQAKHTSQDYIADQLNELKAWLGSEEDETREFSASLADEVRKFGTLREEWLTEKKQRAAWKAVLLKDDPLEEVAAIFTKTETTIEAALRLIVRQLKPLLDAQERVGVLQTRILTLTAEVDSQIITPQEKIFIDGSPSILSSQYFSQFGAELYDEVRARLSIIAWPGPRFFARQGWIILLQGLLSLVLISVFFRFRQQLYGIQRWRFVAQRPISAGVFVAALVASVLYEGLPDTFTFAFRLIAGLAFARLLGGLLEQDWRRQFVYGLAILWLTTSLFSTLNLPLPLFRLYILVAALLSAVCCWRWAVHSLQRGQPGFYSWLLRLGTVLFGFVLMTQLWGNAELANSLFEATLRTVIAVLAFGLLAYLVHGGVEWAVSYSPLRTISLISNNAEPIARRAAFVCDIFIGFILLSGLLVIWQKYASPGEAISALLSLAIPVGNGQITLSLILMAVGLFGLFVLASWILQNVLTDNVLAKRNVASGVRIAISRLVHYALMFTGFVVALSVLRFDLTQFTLLLSALGVGIGFGLQAIVNNFVCGLILLFERPVRVGDTIDLGGQWAEIKRIGLRSTTVQTFDRADVILPNADLITNQVINWTLTDRHARSIIAVGVAHGSDVPLVMQTLKACALAYPGVMKEPEPQILLRRFTESSLDFELRTWVENVSDRLGMESGLHQEIERRFREAGIKLAIQQQEVTVRAIDTSAITTQAVGGEK